MTIDSDYRQRFPVSSNTYWRELCLSLEYQERLYREALGCTRMEVLAHEGDLERGMKRRLRFEKPLDAPTAVKKLFGDAVTIEEQSEFDAGTKTWSYRMVPGMLADRIDIRGVIRLDENADGVEQLSRTTVTCRMFGVGSVVEHFVAKSSNEGNHDKAEFTRRYIAEKGLR